MSIVVEPTLAESKLTESARSTELRVTRVNLATAAASLIVAIVAAWMSYYVPNRLDHVAQIRERNRVCVESVIDLRAAIDKIATGYVTAADSLPGRLADWDGGKYAIERTRVSCRDVPMLSAHGVEEVGDLWNEYHTEQNLAPHGTPTLDVVAAIRNWTTASIRDITTTN